MADPPRTWCTPPQKAAELGVKPETILALIRSGELRAINMARPGSTKPRYRIHQADWLAFEQRRQVVPATKPQRRRRRDPHIIEFF